MQDKHKSNKVNNKEEMGIEENINKPIEQDKKIVVKEASTTHTKERSSKSKSNAQKKITSNKAIKSETNKVLPIIKEKEIIAQNTESKVELKSKKTTKKTSARKSAATKVSVKSEEKQEIDLKIQGNKNNELDKTKKDVAGEKEVQIVAKDIKVEVGNDKETTTRKTSSKSVAKTITSKTSKTTETPAMKPNASTRKSPSKKPTQAQTKAVVAKEVKTQSKSKAEQIKNTVKKVMKKVDRTDITSFNADLFHQGKNYETYNILGSHIKTEKINKGVQFATWAPNAKDVYVVGDFNNFEVKDQYKLEKITENGLWKGFFAEAKVGDKYKYCIIGKDGKKGEYKADPYAIQTQLRPDSASIVYEPKDFKWNDQKWIDKRNKINVLEEPLNIYEVHLGSWKTNKDGGFLTYEEIAEELPKYVKEMGYTHVEIMPLVEHPLDASWGYQGTGYYSPTSRYGTIEGLKKLIDKLHDTNIGVIMDWVPGHFCKDAHGLYKFDGTPTYEYQEEWKAENKGWGTCNFDLGRPEVKSYLISNALYWYREFHIDGLRVDAVSSILYLDYSRSHGEWVPNKFGENGNLEAIDFLKELNKAVSAEYSTALMIAEESTSWPNITKSTNDHGLGFNLKWNMGWMNDTLEYVEIDPKYRKNNHRNITFAMMYNHAENYLLPLSHDEVVHGKKPLIDKMWGDEWNKFAGLRAFMGYMMGHPGKKLVFMGCEFAQTIEWREYEELEWNLIDNLEMHKKTQLFYRDLNNLYINNKAFWELDHDYRGFNWIEADNNEQSILIFTRRSRDDQDTLVFVINFTSKVYYDYQIGVPFLGSYKEIFNTDDCKYGGSGQTMDDTLISEKSSFQNQPYSIKIKVPPMATLILKVNEINIEQEDKVIEELSVNENDELKEMNQ
ncbi:MAG: 1,4-alpha-glucan branching protein GlgB [Clostridium sp.]|uniref:1,4-alpha-glucan branching protein GlgB n=1 Tax=Clostridium sp. TaxID=1506 RepID=UPI0025BEA523|nr:1,4-alpha-glucan branching protein GlgB [Clostridium sp.]MCE5222347.1 1,4-alpha-glucan branching protein GlgB [Clostridium sp.]